MLMLVLYCDCVFFHQFFEVSAQYFLLNYTFSETESYELWKFEDIFVSDERIEQGLYFKEKVKNVLRLDVNAWNGQKQGNIHFKS